MNNKIDEKTLNTLKDEFNNIVIPDELDCVVQAALKQGLDNVININQTQERKFYMKKHTRNIAASIAIIATTFTGAANLSPTFAKSMSNVPIVKDLIKIVSFRQFEYNTDNYNATINTPKIEGLENQDLQQSLNHKYSEENKALFKQFEAEVATMDQFAEPGHIGIDSGFEIKTNTDKILSLGRYTVNTVGSSSTTISYDTIDKENQILITLPSLFKDDTYIKLISENIIEQMKDKMAKDSSLVYWISTADSVPEAFKTIKPNQPFYISSQGKLIISFDKYEIAPGAMGIQEFEIPTKVIQDILVSNTYIK